MASTVFLNTGGGVFGAIRTRIAADQNLLDAFGDRAKAGRASRDVAFPYIIFSHVAATIDDIVAEPPQGNAPPYRWDCWREIIQVSVYAQNYESARQLGRLLHSRISRQTFCADLIPLTLFPDSRTLLIDPQAAEKSADVWHADYRYHYWTADKLLPDMGPFSA